jgi:beta-mannosidase
MSRTQRTFLSTGWEFVETALEGRQEWLPASVPGGVHWDLVANGIIADPVQRMFELGSRWVDETAWSYRCRLDFTTHDDLPHRRLLFLGLDTICRVSVNGEQLARHDNMFLPLEADVTAELRPGENEIRVDFEPALRAGRERRSVYFEREGIPSNVANFDERAFVRKGQWMYGWDWGPRLASCGIWQPAMLVEHASRIIDLWVRQTHEEDGSVTLRLQHDQDGPGRLEARVRHPNGAITEFDSLGRAVIERPELWFPRGLGNQPLYRVEARIVRNDEVLDTAMRDVGLRTVRLAREPDAMGESFEFEVNGRPVYCFGANWVPDYVLPGRIPAERYREQVWRASQMGMNMLRVWGGGIYESREFYEACDHYGVMVWQDFAYSCSYYPDDQQAQEAARAEAVYQVGRLRNHPSLTIWCGNNENLMMWQEKWGGTERAPSRYYGQAIFEQVLPGVVAEHCGELPYIPTSPTGATNAEANLGPGSPASLYANAGGSGDQHYWDVWHGRGDWRHYTDSTARFCSEFGFVSAPSAEAWNVALAGRQGAGVRDPDVRWHDKTGKGYEKYLGLIELHYPEARDLEDLTYYSQLNQRDAMRYAVEHYRRSTFCRGALVWQFNDCWPVQSWSLVDCTGSPKAAAYELARLFSPLALSIVRKGAEVDLWAMLDNTYDPVFNGSFSLRCVSLRTGETLREWDATADVIPGARDVILRGTIEGLAAPETLLLGFSDSCMHTWQLCVEPKQVRQEPASLMMSTSTAGRLAVHTPVPVVDLFLSDDWGGVAFEDNFITIPTPGAFWVRIRGYPRNIQARSLAGRHPVVVTHGPV